MEATFTGLGVAMAEEAGSNAEICVVGRDLTEFSVVRFGSFIRRIDLSFNLLMKLRGLEVCAGTLEELILDNNQLVRLDLRTQFPKLNTLSLNKNRVSNLTFLLNQLTSKVPNLRYLSLLGNPVCPDQLSDERVQESEYANYRCHTLYHLPYLRFLDHRIVSTKELNESQKLSYAQIKGNPSYTPLPTSVSTTLATIRGSSALTENNSNGGGGGGSNLSESDSLPRNGSSESSGGDGVPPKRKGRQGRRRFKYVGKNSEGNRFIKDTDL